MSIVVDPPFWKTIWFRLLLTVVIIGVLFLAVRYYMPKIRKQSQWQSQLQ